MRNDKTVVELATRVDFPTNALVGWVKTRLVGRTRLRTERPTDRSVSWAFDCINSKKKKKKEIFSRKENNSCRCRRPVAYVSYHQPSLKYLLLHIICPDSLFFVLWTCVCVRWREREEKREWRVDSRVVVCVRVSTHLPPLERKNRHTHKLSVTDDTTEIALIME